MANVQLYVLAENLALTNPQRNTLVAAISQLGQSYLYPFPVRLDNQAGIYEAEWRSGDILHYAWRQKLGTLFSVDPLTIDIFEQPVSYSDGGNSTLFTLSRNGTDYLRVIFFGTLAGTKAQSQRECAAYLAANAAAWWDA